MLVGNHDQVSVGGLDHALHPLAAACPAIHVLDEPILYRSVLILYYADMGRCVMAFYLRVSTVAVQIGNAS